MTGVPESYLVAPDGTVLVKIEGGVTVETLDDLLEQVQVGDVDGDHLGDDAVEAEAEAS